MTDVTNNGATPGPADTRVIAFRPRVGGKPAFVKSVIRAAQEPPPQLSDLVEFERPPGQDHYWHRMTVNVVAFAFTLALMIVGIWIASSMAAMRKNQDCVLMGRPSCAPMQVPSNSRW